MTTPHETVTSLANTTTYGGSAGTTTLDDAITAVKTKYPKG